MKKSRVFAIAGAVVLVLSLAANVFLGNQYFKYREMCRHDSEDTLKAAQMFEDIYEKVALIADDGSLDETELADLQKQVTIVQDRFLDYDRKRGIDENGGHAYDIGKRFVDLKDIVFKIYDVHNIDKDIVTAIGSADLVSYLKNATDITNEFIQERYNSQDVWTADIGPNDGEEFYRYFMKNIR